MTIAVAETNTSIALPRKNIGGEAIYYPESDGKPMGETDLHIRLILQLLSLLDTHFHHTEGQSYCGYDVLLRRRKSAQSNFARCDGH
jgi:hypothetical protein